MEWEGQGRLKGEEVVYIYIIMTDSRVLEMHSRDHHNIKAIILKKKNKNPELDKLRCFELTFKLCKFLTRRKGFLYTDQLADVIYAS